MYLGSLDIDKQNRTLSSMKTWIFLVYFCFELDPTIYLSRSIYSIIMPKRRWRL